MPEIEIRQTLHYSRWYSRLRDVRAKARIDVRIRSLSLGIAGDFKWVGHGVRELRVDHGPGYRIYFAKRGARVIILLAAGDKSSQREDIRKAIEMAAGLEE